MKSSKEKDNPKKHINMGLQLTGTLDGHNEALNLIKNWIEEFLSTQNTKIKVSYYEDLDLLYNDFNNKKILDIVVSEPFFYFKHINELETNTNNFWGNAVSKNNLRQEYLISKKDLKFTSFKDIKDKTLVFKKLNYKVDAWIDKQSYKENKKSYKKLVKKIIYAKDEANALLHIFFRKADLAVISKETWNIMIELNPGIKKRVKVVAKSKEIHIFTMGFFHKRVNSKFIDSFLKTALNLDSIPRNEQMRILIRGNHIFKLNKKDIDQLDVFYKEYHELKIKYKNKNDR